MFAVGPMPATFQGMGMPRCKISASRQVSSFTTPGGFLLGEPFSAAHWRGVIARKAGMDLPVSIGIRAVRMSLRSYATFSNGAAVWFDSCGSCFVVPF